MDAPVAAHTDDTAVARRQAFYATLLVGMVLYGLVVCFWPAAPAYCTAQAIVELRRATGESDLPRLNDQELRLVCGIDRSYPTRLAMARTKTGLRISLQTASVSPRTALRHLQAAAMHFSERAPAYVASRSQPAPDRRSKEHEEQSWLAFTASLSRLLSCASDMANEQTLLTSSDEVSLEGETYVSTQIEAPPALNPAWTDLSEQLDSQRQQLEDLLQTRTDSHPEVQAVRAAIEQLSRTLERIPQLAAPVPVSTDEARETDATSASQAEHQVSVELQNAMATLRTQIAALDAARQESIAALDKYSQARLDRQAAEEEPRSLWFAEVIEPAHVLSRENGIGPARHPELLIGAFCIALALAWTIQKPAGEILQSIRQLRGEWGAEIVAVMGDVRPPSAADSSDWTPGVIRIAQWIVLLIVSILLMLSMGDSTLVPNFLHDPALAIREAWTNWMAR